MEDTASAALKKTCEALKGQKLPSWDQLPDLELYMDQVLALVERYLSGDPAFEERGLTASMVNNYVKLGVMPPPVKKRYTRAHLAYLLLICVLKAALPMTDIRRLLQAQTEDADLREVYDRFCLWYQEAGEEAAAVYERIPVESGGETVFRSALRARAEQAVALQLSSEFGK